MNRFQHNVSWVLIGNLLHAAAQFGLNVLAARVFSVEDYGLLSYGAALVAFFAAVGGLGFPGVITRFFARDRERAGVWLGSATAARGLFAVMAIGLIQLAAAGAGPELRVLLLCQSAQVLFSAGEGFLQWFRFLGRAKLAAAVRMGALAVSAAWRLPALFCLRSLPLYAAGVSLETLVYLGTLWLLYRREFGRIQVSRDALRAMLGQSWPFITSAVLSTVYAQTDRLMLNAMLGAEAVGLYSVAVTLAGAISILPSALIEGFRPEIMLRRAEGSPLFEKRLRQLYGLVFRISIAYCLFVTVCARPLVGLLYGADYLGAVPALSVVVWYTAFSYFGAVNNLYLAAAERTAWVQVLTFAGALGNVALNALLIPPLGIPGAALASLLTQFGANFLLPALLPPLRGMFGAMWKGIWGHGFYGR